MLQNELSTVQQSPELEALADFHKVPDKVLSVHRLCVRIVDPLAAYAMKITWLTVFGWIMLAAASAALIIAIPFLIDQIINA
ncbi:MAG: hypothetical protein INR69_22290 [Mucilaginibacter polytrichastri]|nr:hypothetical protein [Mucilaginibacter polytrichastri]